MPRVRDQSRAEHKVASYDNIFEDALLGQYAGHATCERAEQSSVVGSAQFWEQDLNTISEIFDLTQAHKGHTHNHANSHPPTHTYRKTNTHTQTLVQGVGQEVGQAC